VETLSVSSIDSGACNCSEAGSWYLSCYSCWLATFALCFFQAREAFVRSCI
jgi:hypothetical protein